MYKMVFISISLKSRPNIKGNRLLNSCDCIYTICKEKDNTFENDKRSRDGTGDQTSKKDQYKKVIMW